MEPELLYERKCVLKKKTDSYEKHNVYNEPAEGSKLWVITQGKKMLQRGEKT